MRNGKPVIGLTSSFSKEEKAEKVILQESYLDAVRHFGGIPVILPTKAEPEELELLLGLCDGIIFTGGKDIAPEWYGERILNDTVHLAPERDETEMRLCSMAREAGLPILGICRGMQLLNVHFGGTLYQDLPSQHPTHIAHRMEEPYERCVHCCVLEEGSPLHELTGKTELGINTLHHQAVKDLAPGLKAMGRGDDGIIEAICDPNARFIWGVQWHPEKIWNIEDGSAKIFEAFMAACRGE